MTYLLGLQEYLEKNYNSSIFDDAVASEKLWKLHLHGDHTKKAVIAKNLKFDIKISVGGKDVEVIPKIQIKFLYPEALSKIVTPLINIDKKIKALKLEPIVSPGKRNHIKNKSLFPLLKDRAVVFFTLLEGEIIRGIISGFSLYDITVSLKGGHQVVILRHSIHDLRDKKGRCFLKSFQEKSRDWLKHDLFISESKEPVSKR
jgi:hypothetical protein